MDGYLVLEPLRKIEELAEEVRQEVWLYPGGAPAPGHVIGHLAAVVLGPAHQPSLAQPHSVQQLERLKHTQGRMMFSNVADPDPDLPDPHVLGPPGSGSGSISQRYGSLSGSGSFYHYAKIVRKTFISTVL
jgi:hypothetical protein